MKLVFWIIRFLFLLLGVGYVLLRFLNFRPPPILEEPVSNEPGAPLLPGSQSIRILTYNVQYFAGTKYRFFYDQGPDTRATVEDIHLTIERIADFIIASESDFVFLQEVDTGAKRSGYTDQVSLLRQRLGFRYPSSSSSYYWLSKFVPHPKVWGPVGMKLFILSKYQLGKAYRNRLASTPGKPLNRDFNIKRAFLEVEVPTSGGSPLILINTHLEAFTEGTNVLALQIRQILERLEDLDAKGIRWILGGDFNALPPRQYENLPPADRGTHTSAAEIGALFRKYQGVPGVNDVTGPLAGRYYTYSAPDGATRRPICTLDYLFVSPALRITDFKVDQGGALDLSDHLPLTADLTID